MPEIKRLKSAIWITTFCACSSVLSFAAEWPDCANQEYESQAKQNECSRRRHTAADLALNKQYKATIAQLNEVQRKQLITEQRAWLRNLKQGCEESAGKREESGSMWAMEYNNCLAQETKSRTSALKHWPAK